MNFTEYQSGAMKTAIYPEQLKVLYPALGLSGETGEVCEKIKKVFRDSKGIFTPESKAEILKEVGDVLWYLSAICSDLELNFDDAAIVNISKLTSRLERGALRGSGDNR